MPSPPAAQAAEPSSASASAVPEKRKRTKYAAKACIECKRRKVKCCGEQPCQRCRRRMMECVFPTTSSTESRNIEKLLDQIQNMQTQIDTLTGTVGSFSSANSTTSPLSPTARKKSSQGTIPSQSSRPDKPPSSTDEKISFHGVTTFSSNFGIARQTLRSRGITEVSRTSGSEDDDDHGDDDTQDPSPMPSPSLSPRREDHHRRYSIDPLWGINREEAIRLCRLYEDEMGMMYPILELETVINQVNTLYNHLNPLPMSSSETVHTATQEQVLSDEDINILKLVFACALTAEGHGNSELAMRIFRGVRDVASELMWKPPSIKRLTLITLVSIFLFQIDEETTAWRTIGTAQRLCLEIGLHRSETYPQHAIVAYGKENVLKLFWSVYTLDMRFSMGTGMPYHLDFGDIDSSLPRPTNAPYLNTMVSYNRIAEKVWKFITSSNRNQHTRKEEMAYLDWQVTQWYNSMPEFLKLPPSDATSNSKDKHRDQLPPRDAVRSIWRLKALLYLRANLMKILIYRPSLYTPTLVSQSPVEASTVVDIAKDTIRFITHLNQSTDIYQLQQVAFNWFLISALAVLFLAVAHAPAQFTSNCKDEFYMALELIEGFSMHSYVSQRLWKSIKGLRKLAPQIGLSSQIQPQSEASQHVPVKKVEDEKVPLNNPLPNYQNMNTQQDRASFGISAAEMGNTTTIPQRTQPMPTGSAQKQDQTPQQLPLPIHPQTHQHQLQEPSTSIPALTTPDNVLLADGTQMSRELMDWFEAMGELNPAAISSSIADAVVAGDYNNDMMVTNPSMTASWPTTDDFMYGYGSELASILRDCF